MAIFHDQEYKTNEIDVEVQVTIDDSQNQDALWSGIEGSNVSCCNMPATEVASVIISGSYEQMTTVTQSVAQFIEENDYELHGPMFNIYHVSAAQNPDPKAWVTEACFPLRLSSVAR
ncbi:Bacterial transcription activator, effector binding domain [compost metagenome]